MSDSEMISPEIRALVARETKITLAEYKALRSNSWEQELLAKRLDDEALEWAVRNCLTHASFDPRRPPVTYDAALATQWVPILLERLKERTK